MKWNMLVGSLVLGASLCTPSFAGHGLLDRLLSLKGSGCDSTCCDTNACSADPSCGVEAAGCAADPSCGVEAPCLGRLGRGAGPSCGVEACGPSGPSCGVEACGPSCGVEAACCKPRRRPLHELLQAAHCRAHNMKNRLHNLVHCHDNCDTGCAAACEPSCGVADPSCGVEAACDPCAGQGCGPSCGVETACDPCAGRGHGCGNHKGLLSRIFKHRNSCDDGCCDAISSCGCAAPAAPAIGGSAPTPPAPVVDPSAYLQSNRRVIQPTSFVR
jgi:hypothetical protein